MEFAYTCCLNNYQVYRQVQPKYYWVLYDSNRVSINVCVKHTAAVMIMIPIGLAIIKANELNDKEKHKVSLHKFEKSLVLAIGYAGTIGGLGTDRNATINNFERTI